MDVELADTISAFLQTGHTEEHRKLSTPGIKKLQEALGVSHDEALRILSAIYGLTNVVRILWKDADVKFTKGGARNLGMYYKGAGIDTGQCTAS